MDTVEEEFGKLTVLNSFFLACSLDDKGSINVKHSYTAANVELFGVGVILWNVISLFNLV